MRLLAAPPITVTPMPRWKRKAFDSVDLQVRLHDISTDVAIGIGLLKVSVTARRETSTEDLRSLQLFEDALGRLRRLSATAASVAARPPEEASFTDTISAEAKRLRLRLELEVIGNESWLAPNHLELARLVGREAMRNVRRHSAGLSCRVTLDTTTCPYVLRIRDWGCGFQADTRVGSGIGLLRRMAADMGSELGIASQPGLGTEVVLVGPICARDRSALVGGSRPGAGDRNRE